jgi:hypothetical protein
MIGQLLMRECELDLGNLTAESQRGPSRDLGAGVDGWKAWGVDETGPQVVA